MGAHQPFHAFAVDRLICFLIEFDGHSPDSDGAVEFLVVLAHALNQRFVDVSAGGAGVASGPPSVEARPVQAESLAQPLHPRGWCGGRQRTGSGSSGRLSREIFGRLAQDVALGRQLRCFGFQALDLSPQADQLILGFDTLGLQTYLTAGPKEARAWTIRKGWKAPQAAGVIHTDFERGFIKAEIVSFDELVAAGSMADAKAAGKVRVEGKDYVMRDGDVVEFRFNV